MSLFQVTITKIGTKTLFKPEVRILNSNRVGEFSEAPEGTKIIYSDDFSDSKTETVTYIVSESLEDILSVFVTGHYGLSVSALEKGIGSSTSRFPVDVTINQDDVSFGWPDARDSNNSYLRVRANSAKEITYKVSTPLDEVSSIASVFSMDIGGEESYLTMEFTDGENYISA